MSRTRVSVGGLMAWVSIAAVGFASLLRPTELGASGLATLLYGSLVVAALGAVLRRGAARSYWVGFVTCGGGYALFAFRLAATPETPPPHLLTSDLLVLLSVGLTQGLSEMSGFLGRLTTPYAAAHAPFYQTGHSVFALVSAVLGGSLGRAFASGQAGSPASSE